MRDGEILAQASSRLAAQETVQFPVWRTGAMQIRGLRGQHRNAPVVDR